MDHKPLKSRARLLFPSLLLGAFITIAISWSVAAWSPMRESRRWTTQRLYSGVGIYEAVVAETYVGFGWTRRGWEPQQLDGRVPDHLVQWTDCPPTREPGVGTLNSPPISLPAAWPSWGALASQWNGVSLKNLSGCEHATGWPFRAFWYQLEISKPGILSVAGGIPLQEPMGLINTPYGGVRGLPYRPAWLGLGMDVLFWGIIVWALVGRVWITKQALRLRCGLCPKCAYELRGDFPSGCPECGWNRTPLPTQS